MTQKRFSIIDMIIFPLIMAMLATVIAILMIEREERIIAFFMSFYSFNMYFVAISGLLTKISLRKKLK